MKHLTHYDLHYKNIGSNSVLIHILKFFFWLVTPKWKTA